MPLSRPAGYRARSSAGEHYVDIVGVAGSIPAAPTIQNQIVRRNLSQSASYNFRSRVAPWVANGIPVQNTLVGVVVSYPLRDEVGCPLCFTADPQNKYAVASSTFAARKAFFR